MANVAGVANTQRAAAMEGYPADSVRFDRIAALLALWVIGGLYLDGWAHNHGMVDDSFFTPWHAVLYSGVALTTAFLGFHQIRNSGRGYAFTRSLPKGYWLSLIGAGLFLAGGLFDLVWHETFGFEVDLETLLSPAHLWLATSGILIVSGALRAAWSRYPQGTHGWGKLAPAILVTALMISIFSFFTQFAAPISHTWLYTAQNQNQTNVAAFTDLYVMNLDGSSYTRLTNTRGEAYWSAAYSPDGTQIATTRFDPTVDDVDSNLYIFDADMKNARLVSDMAGGEYLPSWSPDGSRIVFVYAPEGNGDLYIVDTAGGEPRPLVVSEDFEYAPFWSPDGSLISYVVGGNLYVISPDGGEPRLVTDSAVYSAGGSWSPDGQRLLFSSVGNLFAINVDGTGLTQLTDHPDWEDQPVLSPDGQTLLYRAWRDDYGNVYTADAACMTTPLSCDDAEVNVSNTLTLSPLFPAFSPDGERILFTGEAYRQDSNPYERQSLGTAAVLIQSALIAGGALLLIQRWTLPFGAFTLIIALNTALMTVFRDNYAAIPIAVGIGLMLDVFYRLIQPGAGRQRAFYGFAFLLPAIYYAAFFAVVQVSDGIDWTTHLWLGAIIMAGAVGLLLSMLMIPPFDKQT